MNNKTMANATPETPAAVRALLCVMLAHANSDWTVTSASGLVGLAGLDRYLDLMVVVARCEPVGVELDPHFDDPRVGRRGRIDAEHVGLVDDRADALHASGHRLRERLAGDRRLLAGA